MEVFVNRKKLLIGTMNQKKDFKGQRSHSWWWVVKSVLKKLSNREFWTFKYYQKKIFLNPKNSSKTHKIFQSNKRFLNPNWKPFEIRIFLEQNKSTLIFSPQKFSCCLILRKESPLQKYISFPFRMNGILKQPLPLFALFWQKLLFQNFKISSQIQKNRILIKKFSFEICIDKESREILKYF